jgi:beta-galactosidase
MLAAGDPDLSFVTVEVLDAAGQVHPTADNTIFFTLRGEGTLLAVGNGNPVSAEGYVGNQRKVFHGQGLVVIKSSGEAGEIHLTAQADGLKGAEAILHARAG